MYVAAARRTASTAYDLGSEALLHRSQVYVLRRSKTQVKKSHGDRWEVARVIYLDDQEMLLAARA